MRETTSRMLIEEFGEIPFLVYSEEKFLKEFGGRFTEFEDDFIPNFRTHPDSNGEYSEGKTIASFDSVLRKFEEMTKDKQNQGLAIQEISKPLLVARSSPSFFPVTFSPLTSSEEYSPIDQIKKDAVPSINAKKMKPQVVSKVSVKAETNVPAFETVKPNNQVNAPIKVEGPKSMFRNIMEKIAIAIFSVAASALCYIVLAAYAFKKKPTHKPKRAQEI